MNPLLVSRQGESAVAADLLVTLSPHPAVPTA
ncbi:MAG: hypothetical protein JWM67_964 [Mycobacterium sp.]|nr:hypothetical protein [Mycobacterium sp.]